MAGKHLYGYVLSLLWVSLATTTWLLVDVEGFQNNGRIVTSTFGGVTSSSTTTQRWATVEKRSSESNNNNKVEFNGTPSAAAGRIVKPQTSQLASTRMPLQSGSTVALITPMHANGDVDADSLRTLLRYHVTSQTDGLCILGTTGEASTLSMSEREDVLRIAVDEVKGKIPILAGTGTIDPRKVKAMTKQAADVGCDACLVVTPYYVKPPQRYLVEHMMTVADWDYLPVVMYNVPGRTGVDMSVESLGICLDHPNIIGIKEATGDVNRVTPLKSIIEEKERTEDVLLYSGDDSTTTDFVLNGGHGCISVTANVAPKRMHDMILAGLQGNESICRTLNVPLDLLHKRLFTEANPMPTKWALERMGMIETSFARPPLGVMDSQYYDIVEEALKEADLLQ